MNEKQEKQVDDLLNWGFVEFEDPVDNDTYISICRALELQEPTRNRVYILLDYQKQKAFVWIEINCFKWKVWEILTQEIWINGIWKSVDTK